MTDQTQPATPQLEMESVPCDFCGAAETDPVLTSRDYLHGLPGEFHVVQCRRCGLRRANPRPTVATLGVAYPSSYQVYDANMKTPRPPRGFLRWALVNYRDYPFGHRAPALLRWLAGPWARAALRSRYSIGYMPWQGDGRLLDLGSAVGRYVGQMAAAGWKAEGLELSEEAVATGCAAGLKIRQGTLPGTDLPPESYDVVTMWHVLEHVPSPAATLKAIHGILKPQGRLLVVVPVMDSLNARWFGPSWMGVDLPRHLTHFTRATLRRHVEAAGFTVEEIVPIRRPAFAHRSLANLAAASGKSWHRSLSQSPTVARWISYLAALLGQCDEAALIARKA